MATTLARIRLLARTSAEWATDDPVLLDGEIGIADPGSGAPTLKSGDGVRPWSALPGMGGAGGGVTDHGDLLGLLDDDHPQYVNNARGDLRYAQLAVWNTFTQQQTIDATATGTAQWILKSAAGNPSQVAFQSNIGFHITDVGDPFNPIVMIAPSRMLTLQGAQTIAADAAELFTRANLAPADGRLWRERVYTSGNWQLETRNDANTTGETAIRITRVGVVVNAVEFGGLSLLHNGSPITTLGTGDLRYARLAAANTFTISPQTISTGVAAAQLTMRSDTAAQFLFKSPVGLQFADADSFVTRMAIGPTGVVDFSLPPTVAGVPIIYETTGDARYAQLAATNVFTAAYNTLSSAQPRLRFQETDAGADAKLWDICTSVGSFFIRTRTDGDGLGAILFEAQRTGTAIGRLTLNTPEAVIAGAAAMVLRVQAPAGTNRDLEFRSDTLTRWQLRCGNVAESGSDAGSDLLLSAYTDAGAFKGSIFAVSRATRVVNFATTPQVGGVDLITTTSGDARYAQLAAANNFTATQTITQGGNALTLKAGLTSDHAYMEFFADSAAQATRSGFIGYSAAGTDHLSITNQQGNGGIILTTAGTGVVSTSSQFVSTKTATNITPNFEASSTQPIVGWNETDAAADNRRWLFVANAETFTGRASSDDGLTANNWLSINRTGIVIDSINLQATALQHNGVAVLNQTASDARYAQLAAANTFTQSGSANSWPISLSSAQPGIRWNETDAAVDNRVWRLYAANESLRWDILSDDGAANSSVMIIDRTGTVVDLVNLLGNVITLTGGAQVNLNATNIYAAAAGFTLSSTTGPVIVLSDLDAGTDEKRWRIRNTTGQFQIATETDAGAAVEFPLIIDRTGAVVDSIALVATAVTVNGSAVQTIATADARYARLASPNTFTATGAGSATAAIVIDAAAPYLRYSESDQAADRRAWLMGPASESFKIGPVSDAGTSGPTTGIAITRSGTTTTSLIELNATSVAASGALSAAALLVTNTAGVVRDIGWYTGTTSRWLARANSVAEGGSNAGSNFEFIARDDAGASIGTVYSVTRATRVLDFNIAPTIGGVAIITTTSGDARYAQLGASNVFTSADQTVSATVPKWRLQETDAGVDEKLWEIIGNGGDFEIRTRTDANGTGQVALELLRVGTLVTNLQVNADISNFQSLADNAALRISGPALKFRDIDWRTVGSARWTMRVNSDAETGSNAGSNFQFMARDDAAATLGSVFTVTRATRVLDFSVAPTIVGAAIMTQTAGDLRYAQLAAGNTFTASPQRIAPSTAVAAQLQLTPGGTSQAQVLYNTPAGGGGFHLIDITAGNIPRLSVSENGALMTLNATTIKVTPSGATPFEIESTMPLFVFDETDAPANERTWMNYASAGELHIGVTATDAAPNTGVSAAIRINRTGTTIDSIGLAATTLNMTGAVNVTGSIAASSTLFAPTLVLTQPQPYIEWNENDVAATERRWIAYAGGEAFAMGAMDGSGNTNNFLVVQRTAQVIDSLGLAGTSIVMTGVAYVDGGGQALTLRPASTDHAYMAFNADSAAPTTRSGYLGYAAAGSARLTIKNEMAGGDISIASVSATGGLLIDASGNVSTGALYANAGLLVVEGTSEARIRLRDSGAAANEKEWVIYHGGTSLQIFTANDAGSGVDTAMSITRVGTAVGEVQLSKPLRVGHDSATCAIFSKGPTAAPCALAFTTNGGTRYFGLNAAGTAFEQGTTPALGTAFGGGGVALGDSPTWTGQHKFTFSRAAAGQHAISIESGSPSFRIRNTSGGTHGKNYSIATFGDNLFFQNYDDTEASAVTWMQVARSGTTTTEMTLTATNVTVTGALRATGNVTAFYSSDARLKRNVRPIENALAAVLALSGVRFDWSDEYLAAAGGEHDYFARRADVGVLAHEVERVLPEIVATRADGYKAIKYERLCALLIEAVKELAAKVGV